jgi:hypothetical protein
MCRLIAFCTRQSHFAAFPQKRTMRHSGYMFHPISNTVSIDTLIETLPTPNIYPLFHFTPPCDAADRRGSDHFCEIKMSIFTRDSHFFTYPMISLQTLTYRIEIQSCPFL